MKKGTILNLICLMLLATTVVYSQNNKTDSLRQLYSLAKHDTTRIQLLLKIGSVYKYQIPDSSFNNYNKALQISEHAIKAYSEDQVIRDVVLRLKALIKQDIGIVHKNQSSFDLAMENYRAALKIFEQLNDSKGIAGCYSNIGIILWNLGQYNPALDTFKIALKISEKYGYKKRMAACYNNMGLIYSDLGNFEKSLEYYFKSLAVKEELNDKKGISSCYNNIGIIHHLQGSYEIAVENYLSALKISKELGDKERMSQVYNNIGMIKADQGIYDEALEYYFESLNIDEEVGDIGGMAMCYNNIGLVYHDQGNFQKANYYYKISLKLSEDIGDIEGVVMVNTSLSTLNIALANSTEESGSGPWIAKMNSAIKYGHKAYDLALEMRSVPLQNYAIAALQEAYTEIGNYKKALKYAELYIVTLDSMFSDEKTMALTEMTTKYETEKKQLEIDKMEKQKQLDDLIIEAQNAKNRKQQIIIFTAISGFIIILVFFLILLRLFRQKRAANILLAKQNDEIKQQKDQIEEQNLNITDSIVYAQRIQRALLPPGDYMKQLLPHRFILYKPRDIVSGDFYWVNKKDNLIITVAADCTGHGVPGAMMSMLGVSIINEIINTLKIRDAGEILNRFRSKLIDSLHQGGKESHMFDGIDVALCLIDLKENNIQFSGANCPLYLFRDKRLIEIKGDKMPIGTHPRIKPFTNHNMKILQGDMLYLFSDGYSDQFGGENDKRFNQRRFKKLLSEIHEKSMTDQKEILDTTFEKWKGNSDQIDDILVMGVKI